jgi:hypothetical protein
VIAPPAYKVPANCSTLFRSELPLVSNRDYIDNIKLGHVAAKRWTRRQHGSSRMLDWP